VWSKANRKNFKEFLFCVIGNHSRLDLRVRNTPMCPEVGYYIVIETGIDFVNKTALLRIIRQKAKEGYIRRYYKRKGITSP
jgi:hypothetical protein